MNREAGTDLPPASSTRMLRWVCLETLRAAARDRVERTSLRAVAREMGISAPGLKLLLAGTSPRPSTVRKLREWYFSEAAARADDLSPAGARAAVEVLVEGVPPPRRPALVRQILEILAAEHVRQGTHPPGWLRSLREHQTENPRDREHHHSRGGAAHGAHRRAG